MRNLLEAIKVEGIVSNSNGKKYLVMDGKISDGRIHLLLLDNQKNEAVVAIGWSSEYGCWSQGYYYMFDSDRNKAISMACETFEAL